MVRAGAVMYTFAPMPQNQPHESAAPIPVHARFKLAAQRWVLILIAKCVSINGLYFLGRIFGLCEWMINYKRRRRFHKRMKYIFGSTYDPIKMRGACRGFFVRTRCDKIYYLIIDLLPPEEVLGRVEFATRTNVDQSLARGGGAYLAVSHFGAHHIAANTLAQMGYKMAGVRDRNEGAMRRYIQQRLVQRLGQDHAAIMFFADAFPRDLFRWFHANGILASALDTTRSRDSHLKRATVQLFGESRSFLTGPVQIALRCRAVIHEAFVISKPNFHYEIVVSDPLIDPDSAADTPQIVQQVMQSYAARLETHARRYPDHVSRV